MFLTTRVYRPTNQIDRIVEGLLNSDPHHVMSACMSPQATLSWPRIDVTESDSAVHISAELPGVKQDQIEVVLQAEALRISGEKKNERVVESQKFHTTERMFGRFDRTIPLPSEIDRGSVDATFQDGVLTIIVPKLVSSPQLQKIVVKSSS